MQVKTHVKAIFPRALGPPTMQLAKQRTITADEKRGGESRSVGLERDIMITEGIERPPATPAANHNPAEILTGLNNGTGGRAREPSIDSDVFLENRRLIEDLARAHPHQQTRSPNHQDSPGTVLNGSSNPSINDDNVASYSWRVAQRSSSSSIAGNLRQDGRRRDGTYGF